MRTAFFASDPIALDAIEFLHKSREYPLACVVSNPDRPKGRGNKVTPNEVSAWALDNGVELMRPENGIDETTVSRLRDLNVELIVVMAYGCMLKKNVLEYGKYPCLNLHGSILPKYRGASPIETAIALGDSETGVSLMRIVKKMDAGAVCDVEKIGIEPDDTAATLRQKFRAASPMLLARNLDAIKNGTAKFTEQDESLVSYTRKFDKSDMAVDFSACGKDIVNRIRAFGCGILECNGEQIKVRDAEFEACATSGIPAGKVCEASSQRGLRVACSDGIVSFFSLQKPCAKMMAAKEFFSGYKIFVGEILKFQKYKNLLK